MRLFIAIDLPTDVKQELAETARSLGRQATSARLVPEENFHLTLVFIGESQRVDDIRRVMTEVCALH
ncbi:MAG: hypothetical protein LBR39_02315, partial [Coriobacteriales bacterium]|nr:hypothetical protein [Coriobacteriales bacterium]